MMAVRLMMPMVVRVLVMVVVMIDDAKNCFFLPTGLYFKVITHSLK